MTNRAAITLTRSGPKINRRSLAMRICGSHPASPIGAGQWSSSAIGQQVWLAGAAVVFANRDGASGRCIGRLSEAVFAGRLVHAVFDEARTAWLLTSRAKEPPTYLTNPDGGRAQLRRFELLKIDPGGAVSMSALGETYGAYPGAL